MSVNVRDRAGRIRELQRMLRFLGMRWGEACMCVPVTGCWNEGTESAVRAFQARECLPATGICDRETWEWLRDCCEEEEAACAPVTLNILPRDWDWCLSPGEADDAVFLLQYILRALAEEYALGEIALDGIYGEQTEGAVRRFQEAAGIPVTGRAERETWRRMAEAFNALAP